MLSYKVLIYVFSIVDQIVSVATKGKVLALKLLKITLNFTRVILKNFPHHLLRNICTILNESQMPLQVVA